MRTLDTSLSRIEKVRLPIAGGEPFSLDIKRDDLIDPIVSGNKWRKLKYNFLKAKERKNVGIVTFGGAFSNHLIATAKAASLAGINAVGIVRGNELHPNSNETLKRCHAFGMDLVFVDRSAYRKKNEATYINELRVKYPNHLVIPEGGRNYYGVIGCQEIMTETENNYDHIYLAGGTGTTGAGVVLSGAEQSKVHVVSALKGDFLKAEIAELLYLVLNDSSTVDIYLQQLKVHNDAHFGGYAKVTDELIAFINQIDKEISLKLDPIYTAKAFYQMVNDYTTGLILPTEKVLFIHTGGLQGRKAWADKLT